MPVFSAEKSKIKMVILTKGTNTNAVWFSPINQNKRPNALVITSMLRRFKKSAYANITNMIQFYEQPFAKENLLTTVKP
jgi:hypothetical protein